MTDQIPDAPYLPQAHLAQELVDYIIDFVHDDPTALLRMSLVSKAWVCRTRTHLCRTLNITRSKLLLNHFYLTPLCKYVKTLRFAMPRDAASASAVLNCFEQSEPHTLGIHDCEVFSERTLRECFAKFPCTSITAFEICDGHPDNETFLILLSLFPSVDDLTISISGWGFGRGSNDNEIIKRISPPRLGGSFKCFTPPDSQDVDGLRDRVLNTIVVLPLQFRTISLESEDQSRKEIGAFLDLCSKTARKVFIALPYRKSWPCIHFTTPSVQCANA